MANSIAESLEGLYLVYNAKNPLTGDAFVALMRQYRDAVKGATATDVERACQVWQFERKMTKFPLPQDLKALVESFRPRNLPKVEAWEMLSEAEMTARDYTLAQKARYYRVLAAEIRKTAGPMPIDAPRGFGPWNMSPEWQAAQDKANEIEAKAAKLEKLVKSYRNGERPVVDVAAKPSLTQFLNRIP